MDGFALPPDLVIGWGHGPLRDRRLLESALAAPLHSFAGCLAYPTVLDQAAALLEHITRNHPFIDGNKRSGWHACRAYLDDRGMPLRAETGEAVSFVESVARGELDHREVVVWLGIHIRG